MPESRSPASTPRPVTATMTGRPVAAKKPVAIRSRELEPLGPRGGEAHVVPLARQERLEDLPHDFFVVDDQNGTIAAHMTF